VAGSRLEDTLEDVVAREFRLSCRARRLSGAPRMAIRRAVPNIRLVRLSR
jgi:hypothetical protein